MNETRLVIGPNAALTPTQAAVCCLGISFVSLLICAVFVYHGFWPVLPFAGLELSALALAFWISLRDGRYREVLVFSDQRLELQIGRTDKGIFQQIQLDRTKARAWLEKGPYHNSPSRLLIAEGSSRFVVARCLTDEERVRLCTRIRELLTPEWHRVWAVRQDDRETGFDLEIER